MNYSITSNELKGKEKENNEEDNEGNHRAII